MRLILILLLTFRVICSAVDFDCIVVGSSPFCLLEALYRSYTGNKVLVLEAANECGGAWKSIDICGIPHVDLGCHQIGSDQVLKDFLAEYVGCNLVCLENPLIPISESSRNSSGYYFSKGCYELIDHLLQLIAKSNIVLLLGKRVESASIEPDTKTVLVRTEDQNFTANKILAPQMSYFTFDNQPNSNPWKNKYYHLYMLIQDSTQPRFCYQNSLGSGISRAMNLTHLVGLSNTGRQLIVIQTHMEQALADGQKFLDQLKAKSLSDESAIILRQEPYVYEQCGSLSIRKITPPGQEVLEIIPTGHFQTLSQSVSKWKQVFRPFKEVVSIR